MTSIDERGRIVIPRGAREELGLTPGQPVIIERVERGILVRPALPMKEALRRLRGAIPRTQRAKRRSALDFKGMWLADLPHLK
ncbi:MAG: AbrB/MazE/SpoVT family DNA-binding domain-containing protein [Thermoplasmatota archaeon]